jgi:hypothetical protein
MSSIFQQPKFERPCLLFPTCTCCLIAHKVTAQTRRVVSSQSLDRLTLYIKVTLILALYFPVVTHRVSCIARLNSRNIEHAFVRRTAPKAALHCMSMSYVPQEQPTQIKSASMHTLASMYGRPCGLRHSDPADHDATLQTSGGLQVKRWRCNPPIVLVHS